MAIVSARRTDQTSTWAQAEPVHEAARCIAILEAIDRDLDQRVMRVDGSHVRRVTRSKLWDSAPDWGPR